MYIISLSQVKLYAWADNTPTRTKDCLKKSKVNTLMWEENVSWSLIPRQKTASNQRMLRRREIVFPRDTPSDWLANTK